jgi:hypothetical protein
MKKFEKATPSLAKNLKEIDDHLERLAELIISFLQTIDGEGELYYLVEKLCQEDQEVVEKLSFIIDSYVMDKDFRELGVIPSESKYAH